MQSACILEKGQDIPPTVEGFLGHNIRHSFSRSSKVLVLRFRLQSRLQITFWRTHFAHPMSNIGIFLMFFNAYSEGCSFNNTINMSIMRINGCTMLAFFGTSTVCNSLHCKEENTPCRLSTTLQYTMA